MLDLPVNGNGYIYIKDKLREIKLRWLCYIKRSKNAQMRRCENIDLSGCRRDR